MARREAGVPRVQRLDPGTAELAPRAEPSLQRTAMH